MNRENLDAWLLAVGFSVFFYLVVG